MSMKSCLAERSIAALLLCFFLGIGADSLLAQTPQALAGKPFDAARVGEPSSADFGAASLAGTCFASTSEDATVLALSTDQQDVSVEVATVAGRLSSFVVSVRDSAGAILGSQVVSRDADGAQEVVFPDVLAGAESRPIRYSISVEETGGAPLMSDYPFSILLECLDGVAKCSTRAVPGFVTSGILVTDELDDALEAVVAPDLLTGLELVELSRPDLSIDVATVEHQLLELALRRLAPVGRCKYEITITPSETESLAGCPTPEPGGEEPVLEGSGPVKGAFHCYRFQGIQGTEPASHYTCDLEGQTELRVRARLVESGKGCPKSCGGTVVFDEPSVYRTCSRAAVEITPQGEGNVLARANQSMDLWLNDESLLSNPITSHAEQDLDLPGSSNVEDKTTFEIEQLLDGPIPFPLDLTLETTTHLHITAENGVQGSQSLSPWGIGDSGNEFVLAGSATTHCGPAPESFYWQFTGSDVARIVPAIKIQCWRDCPY